MGYGDYVNQHGFGPRARRVINDLLGSDCNGLRPERLAIRLSEFSKRDVLRTQKVGRVTTKQIEIFLQRHGRRFTREVV
jgi:hypothetical protein